MAGACFSRSVSPLSLDTGVKRDAIDERRCKLCGAAARFRFAIPLNRGLKGEYFECESCELLQSYHLDDLTESELREIYRLDQSVDLDPAAAWRQYCVAARLIQMSRLGLFPRRPAFKVLDFGCGAGFALSYLAWKRGWTTYGFDPYGSFGYSPHRCFSDWESIRHNGPYHLVIASEAWEHLRHPGEEFCRIREVLDPNMAFAYATTEPYKPGRHQATWTYLAPQSGHHVAFYSHSTMGFVARCLGIPRVETAGAEIEWLLAREAHNPWRRLQHRTVLAGLRFGVALGLLPKIC